MSRTYRRQGAVHLRQAVLWETARDRPEAWAYHAHLERHPDPNAPDLRAAVNLLQQDRRSHRYACPPWAHRQVQNRRDRRAMTTDLVHWIRQPEQDDPAHVRHRHSQQRLWDWW